MRKIMILFALIAPMTVHGVEARHDMQLDYDWLIYQQLLESNRLQRQLQFDREQERIHRSTREKIRIMSGAFPQEESDPLDMWDE